MTELEKTPTWEDIVGKKQHIGKIQEVLVVFHFG